MNIAYPAIANCHKHTASWYKLSTLLKILYKQIVFIDVASNLA